MIFSIILIILLISHINNCAYSIPIKEVYESPEYTNEFWFQNAQKHLQQKLSQTLNTNIAKNVIIFIGDGMSISTITGTRLYLGGEEKSLSFESFQHSGLAKTYCVDHSVSDSPITATAILCGIKGNVGTVGVNAHVKRYDCKKQLDTSTHADSIAKWAMDAGKVTGIVTTRRVTDATPAAAYSHSADRYWENNQEIIDHNCDPNELDDIAEQLVFGNVGSQFNVILGCGRQEFRDKSMNDEEGHINKRTDGKNLIQYWLDGKNGTKHSYVWNATSLNAVNPNETDYLLGLFDGSHCPYHLETIDKHNKDYDPTLSQMVDKSIDILQRHDQGFFLFVEGGLIDQSHHENRARVAIDETVEFHKAIQLAQEKLKGHEDTLFVVTADHSQAMTYSGYADRGGDIFGTGYTEDSVIDDLPYMLLNYATGPGFDNHIKNGKRVNLTTLNTKDFNFRFPAAVHLNSGSHAGEDVVVYANGPWSHLFDGVYEQNYIAHAMAYAACIGDGQKACTNKIDNLFN